jgi:hypothetical protein
MRSRCFAIGKNSCVDARDSDPPHYASFRGTNVSLPGQPDRRHPDRPEVLESCYKALALHVRSGSIASVWRCPDHFRSSPMNRHHKIGLTGPFRAKNRPPVVMPDHRRLRPRTAAEAAIAALRGSVLRCC